MRDDETATPTAPQQSVEAINGRTTNVSGDATEAPAAGATADAIARNRFDAFISYSRRVDLYTAQALRRELQRFAKPWFRRSAANVFLDDTNLSVDPHLWIALRQQIDASSFFILFASPEAAQSDWVATELVWWLSAGRCDDPKLFQQEQVDRGRVARTMLVLTDGDVQWDDDRGDFDWETTTALPKVVRGAFEGEPAWVDLRWARALPGDELGRRNETFMKAVAKLGAPIRGIDIVPFIDKDYAEHRRTLRHAWTAVALLAGLLLLVAVLGWRSRQLEAAERAQRIQTQSNESRLLASLSRTEASRNNAIGAALLSLRGLPAATDPEPKRPVVDETVRSLQDAIYAYSASRLVWTFEGHGGQRQASSEMDDLRAINAVSVSPDGTRVLTASPDATARVLDVDTGRELFALPHRFDVYASTYSPDGRFIVTGSMDGLASLWDAANGKNLSSLNHWADKDCGSGATNIESAVSHVSVSPDARHVLTNARTGRRVWSVANVSRPRCEGATAIDMYDPSGIYGLSIEPNGFTVRTVADGRPYLHVERTAQLKPGAGFAPQEKRVLAGFNDGHVELWNLSTKTKTELRLPTTEGLGITGFDGTGAPIAFTSNGEEVALWNVERATRDWGVPLALFGPGAAVSTVVAGSAPPQAGLDGGQILIALFNQQAPSAGARGLVIDRKTGSILAQLLHPSGPIKVASFSRDGRRLVTGSATGTISLWDTSFADLGKVDRRSISPTVVVSANPRDSDHVLTASADGQVRFWNVATGDEVWAVPAGFGPLEDAQLGPNGKYLVLRDSARRMRVYSVDPMKSRGSLGLQSLRDEAEDVGAAAFDASGERLIIGRGDGSVWLWDLAGLDKRKVHQAQAPTRYVGVSRGGSHMMSGHGQVTLRRDNNLYVWTTKEPRHVVALYGHSLPVLGSEVHEDAGRAVSYWHGWPCASLGSSNGSTRHPQPTARLTRSNPLPRSRPDGRETSTAASSQRMCAPRSARAASVS